MKGESTCCPECETKSFRIAHLKSELARTTSEREFNAANRAREIERELDESLAENIRLRARLDKLEAGVTEAIRSIRAEDDAIWPEEWTGDRIIGIITHETGIKEGGA